MSVSFEYIYKKNGGYEILKNNTHYGWYDDLALALFDRDRFIQTDWDWDTFLALPEVPNPYQHMKLPEFDSTKTYISHVPEHWTIQKWIDGKNKYFGSFRSKKEAEERVKQLIEVGWNKELLEG